MSTERVVAVGAGQASAQFIDELRAQGFEGGLLLVGEEAHLPYQRPPLSKAFLAGVVDRDWLAYRPPEFYARRGVELRLGRRAAAIDRAQQTVLLDDGERVAYDRLLLATGARPRCLAVPGADLPGVAMLRGIADAEAIRAHLPTAADVAIIGGGFIGLEVAAILAVRGHAVTVIEAGPRVLGRAVAPEVSAFFAAAHRARGVRIVENAQIAEISSTAGALAVDCAGESVRADLVVVGIGIEPETGLAEAAGLACRDGILVDERCRTRDPAILAAGDCTRFDHPLLGRSVRLETVHNAVEQGRTAAHSALGHELPYRQTPWVWSDQYGYRLQSVGDGFGYDSTVLRGDPAEGRFSLCYFSGGQFLGLNAVNRPGDFAAARRILDRGLSLAASDAADLGFDLGRIAPKRLTHWFEREFGPSHAA